MIPEEFLVNLCVSLYCCAMITANQLRAARALLGWEQRHLAEASSLSLPTVKRLEGSRGALRGNYTSVSKIERALAAAGITFIGNADDEIGVVLKMGRP